MGKIIVEINEKLCTNIEKFLKKYEELLEGINTKLEHNRIIYFSKNKDKSGFIHKIAYVLANFIIDRYEKILLNNIIVNNYIGFTKIEREEIVEIAKEIIENDDNIIDKLFYIRRKNYIYERLIEYLEVDTNIILEGFVNFRLKNYKMELENIVERAVDTYITEKEYNEFINLLKYFINIQESKIDVVYLTLHIDGSYELHDKDNKDISYLYVDEIQEELLNSKLSKEDILLGSLITISPQKIIIKKEDEGVLDNEIFNTISNVFGDRIDTE